MEKIAERGAGRHQRGDRGGAAAATASVAASDAGFLLAAAPDGRANAEPHAQTHRRRPRPGRVRAPARPSAQRPCRGRAPLDHGRLHRVLRHRRACSPSTGPARWPTPSPTSSTPCRRPPRPTTSRCWPPTSPRTAARSSSPPGAPRSAGDDETRVLSTVRRVVHPGGRLALRAGVTCGSVFAGDYGPFYRKTYSIAGDVVNLAARLMTKALPGQVHRDDRCRRAVTQRVRDDCRLPPFTVKGKAQADRGGARRRSASRVRAGDRGPAAAHRPRRRTGHARRRCEPLPFQGRGRVVDIVGVPGIGKTRLIEELGHRVPARVLWADGDIYGRATPYQPLQRLLRRTLALPVDVSDDVVAQALADLVRGIGAGSAAVAAADRDRRRRRTADRRPRSSSSIRRCAAAGSKSATSDLLGRLLPSPAGHGAQRRPVHGRGDAGPGSPAGRRRRRTGRGCSSSPGVRPTPCPVDADPNVTTIELQPLDAIAAAAELLGVATDAAPLPAHRLRATGRPGRRQPAVPHPAGRAPRRPAPTSTQLPDSLEGHDRRADRPAAGDPAPLAAGRVGARHDRRPDLARGDAGRHATWRTRRGPGSRSSSR